MRKRKEKIRSNLVGHFPRLEALEVLKQHLRKPSSEFGRNSLKRPHVQNALCDALEVADGRNRRLVERLLKLTHGLENVRRSICDHEGRQENAHIDVLGSESRPRRAVAKGGEHVNAVKAVFSGRNGRFLAEEKDKGIEAEKKSMRHSVTARIIQTKSFKAPDGLHILNSDSTIGSEKIGS